MKNEGFKRHAIDWKIHVNGKSGDDLIKEILEFIEADAIDKLEKIKLLKAAAFEIFSDEFGI